MAEITLVAIVAVNLGFLVVGIGWLLSYWRYGSISASALGLLLFLALVVASTTADEAQVSLIEAAVFALIVYALLNFGIVLSTRARV